MKYHTLRSINLVTLVFIFLILNTIQIDGSKLFERNVGWALAKPESSSYQLNIDSSFNNRRILSTGVSASNSLSQPLQANASAPINIENIKSMAGYNATPIPIFGKNQVSDMVIYLPFISELDAITTINIKNTGSEIAKLDILYYELNNSVPVEVPGEDLPPHASHAIKGQPYPGFEGSAIIQSNGPIVSIVNIEKAGKSSFMSYNGQFVGNTQMVLPKIMKDFSGWNSELWVQNVDSVTANVVIQFHPIISGNAYSISDAISPANSKKYLLSGIPDLGSSFFGWVSVSSSEKMTAVAVETDSNSNKASAYNGDGYVDFNPSQPRPVFETHFPIQQKNINGLSTITTVVNATSVDLESAALYYDSNGNFTSEDDHSLQHGTLLDLPITTNSNIPDGFDGSMVLQSNGPLVSLNTLQNSDLSSGDAYATFSDYPVGGNSIELPRVANIEAEGLETQFSIQNLSVSGSANITMTYFDQSGSTSATINDTIPYFGVKRYLTSEINSLGQDWEGSVTVTSDQFITGDVLQIVLAQPPVDKTPVVIIPGLMGSRLFNPSEEIWANVCRILASSFPPTDNEVQGLRSLALGPDGKSPPLGHENDPLYQINTKEGWLGLLDSVVDVCPSLNTPYGLIGLSIDENFYNILVNHFNNKWGYQLGKDLFIYPYDWRKDLIASADGLDSLVQDIQAQTGKQQVDIVAHSLGGLVAVQYISDSQRAAKVKHAAILGTPILGTPKAFRALQDGECIYNVLAVINNNLVPIELCIPRMELVRDLSPNFPAFYQIMPSKTYFEANGGGFYGVGLLADVAGVCPDCLNFSQTYNQQIIPTLNLPLNNQAQTFHAPLDKPDQWNWNNVDVTLFVGYDQSTLAGIRELTYFDWTKLKFEKYHLPVYAPIGDGTVVTQSASLLNPLTGFNHLGAAKVEYFQVDHMGLVQNSGSLCRMDFALGLPVSCTSAIQSKPDADALFGAQLVAFGVQKIDVTDTNGNHTGPNAIIPEFIEQGIPGSAYNTDQFNATVALLGGQTYTVTVTPMGDRPVDINLMRISGSEILTTTLYTGVDVKANSLIRLVGDPYMVNTWQLDVDGDGKNIQTIKPSIEYSKGEIPDDVAPTVSITINGSIGPNGWYPGPVSVSLSATDNSDGSGIAYIEYAFGNNREPHVYTGPFIADPALVSTVNAIAVDRAGNQSSLVSTRIGPEEIHLPLINNRK